MQDQAPYRAVVTGCGPAVVSTAAAQETSQTTTTQNHDNNNFTKINFIWGLNFQTGTISRLI